MNIYVFLKFIWMDGKRMFIDVKFVFVLKRVKVLWGWVSYNMDNKVKID